MEIGIKRIVVIVRPERKSTRISQDPAELSNLLPPDLNPLGIEELLPGTEWKCISCHKIRNVLLVPPRRRKFRFHIPEFMGFG